MLPFVYLISFLFKGPLSAYATTVFVLSVVSMVRPVTFIDDIVELTVTTKLGQSLVDSWSSDLDKIRMHPDRDTIQFSNCNPHLIQRHAIKVHWTAVLPKAGKTPPISTFWNGHNNIMKPKAKRYLFSKLSKMRCRECLVEKSEGTYRLFARTRLNGFVGAKDFLVVLRPLIQPATTSPRR